MKQDILNYFSNTNTRTKGIIIALLGAILMSFDPIFIRFSGVGGFDTIFLFGLFTAISMSILVQKTEKRSILQLIRINGWPLIIPSFLMLGSASAFVFSVKNTSVANTFIILSATPAVAALVSWIVLKEKTNRTTWLAIFFVILGVFIVVNGSFNSGNWKGDLLAFISVLCLSVMFTTLRKYSKVNRFAVVALGGFFLAFVMFFFAKPSSYSIHTWVIMATMGLFSAPLGRVLSMIATRYVTASEISLALMFQNVLAPILAFLFFNEVPNTKSLIGGGIIFLTIVLYIINLSKQSNKK